MRMDSFITKDGRRLRRGFTTGTCAAAASKAAAVMLLTGRELHSVCLVTPAGIGLDLPLENVERGDGFASCAVRKDSGDDPDVTNGLLVYARVEKTAAPGIILEGGAGIGRVTKPGLDQGVGEAAINSTPRRMIAAALREVCEDAGYPGGLHVVLSAPGGEEIAKRTFNPRLGIVGGISILGTTGIVEPMSDAAVVETVRAELSTRRAAGRDYVLLVPGNFGAEFVKDTLGFDPEDAVTVSNFIGDAFSLADELGFRGALLVGHIGKTVKLSAGLFNTHSRYGDGRAEIFAAHAAACGADPETARRLLESASTDDMLDIVEGAGIRQTVMDAIMGHIDAQLATRPLSLRRGVMAFSKKYGLLGQTEDSGELLRLLREEQSWYTS